MSCGDLGRATVVGVWAKAETTCGTFVLPAATDVILSTATPSASQEYPSTDSLEISESLDVLDIFQSAAAPLTFTIPMYSRVPVYTALSAAIQGDVLFQSLLGGEDHTCTAAVLAGDWTDSATSLGFDTLAVSRPPDMGVIVVGTEWIFYRGITWSTSAAGTFDNCTRGYAGTTAAAHLEDAAIAWKSRFFKQDNSSPPFSLLIKLDHTTLFLSGCAVNTATLGVTNEGAMAWNFDGQGISLLWAGTDALDGAATAAQADIVVNDAKRFSVGAYIQNTTTSNDGDNSGAGFKIIAIDTTTDTITMDTNVPTGNWDNLDVIVGMVPGKTETAFTVENRYTDLYIDDVAASIQNTDFNFSCPKLFISDEVGSTFPTAFVEDKRSITGSVNLYYRAADAKYMYENTQRTEVPIHVIFGNTEGQKMGFSLRRTKLLNPVISGNGPTLNMALNMTALGQLNATTTESGENSVELVTL